MKKTIAFLIAIVVLSSCSSRRATLPLTDADYDSHRDTLIVMSYNVENLFDPEDDPDKNDNDFTPDGSYHWTRYKMRQKANRIKQVIMAANGTRGIGNHPAIVGLCEIEGEKALRTLCDSTGLNRVGYRYITFPTPDRRGVATGMLYDSKRVDIVESKPISVCVPDSDFITRDVLYAKFTFDADTFHIMVNHWPSKYGGAIETIWKREYVANKLRTFCDSIRSAEKEAKILLIGDFNDTDDAPALTKILGATSKGNPYVNLSADTPKSSYKYQGSWGTIDHIIVSPSLAKPRPIFEVCDLQFIREDDTRYGGFKPFRTFIGQRFNNGYSDHFPVMVKIVR
ncbi:MAG: hypothetical protein MJZ01_00160 [Bacteroidales bacterium]|nr:hypothetical protein [Bacteroidales bacterium]